LNWDNRKAVDWKTVWRHDVLLGCVGGRFDEGHWDMKCQTLALPGAAVAGFALGQDHRARGAYVHGVGDLDARARSELRPEVVIAGPTHRTEFHAEHELAWAGPGAIDRINFACFTRIPNARESELARLAERGARVLEVVRSAPANDLRRQT